MYVISYNKIVKGKLEEVKRLLISYLVVNFVRVEIMFLFSYLHVLPSPHISNGHILLSLLLLQGVNTHTWNTPP
jgi:hypothetical protein